MFLRQERVALLLLLIVAGVVIASHLVLDQIGKRPFARPLTNETPDGALVIFSGAVDHVSLTRTGGHMVVLVDNTPVFIPAQAAANLTLLKGHNVTVIGTVQTYRGKKEVIIQSPSDISRIP